jgi:hypothetical protein
MKGERRMELEELQDKYHRYVVAVVDDHGARVLEVERGEVTRQFWTARPMLREHVGRKWSEEHPQSSQCVHEDATVQETIKILHRVVSAGDHTHLILAGGLAWKLRNALPYRLSARFVDVVDISHGALTRNFAEKEDR